MSNTELWDKNKDVPLYAQKKITGGRLKNLTDIKPQWRLLALTEMFGAIGFGWRYETTEHWTDTANTEVSVHVRIKLFVKHKDVWSEGIEGIGGSMLLAKESAGYHHSDEAYKMATTDAISVACKQIGLGATVYMGCDYSKYSKPQVEARPETNKEIIIAEEYSLAMDNAKTTEELKAVLAKANQALNTKGSKMIVADSLTKNKARLKL